jgi:hypothetical protein
MATSQVGQPEIALKPPSCVLRVMAMLRGGLVNLRVRHDRQRTHDAVLAMARGVSASTGAEFLERLTSSMVEALGAQSGFLVRIGPDGRPDPAAGWAVLGKRSVPAFDCGLLRHALAAFDGDGLWTVARDAARRPELAEGLESPGLEAFVGTRLADNAGRQRQAGDEKKKAEQDEREQPIPRGIQRTEGAQCRHKSTPRNGAYLEKNCKQSGHGDSLRGLSGLEGGLVFKTKSPASLGLVLDQFFA